MIKLKDLIKENKYNCIYLGNCIDLENLYFDGSSEMAVQYMLGLTDSCYKIPDSLFFKYVNVDCIPEKVLNSAEKDYLWIDFDLILGCSFVLYDYGSYDDVHYFFKVSPHPNLSAEPIKKVPFPGAD